MPKAYSGDLRVRVIEMVRAGASRGTENVLARLATRC